MTQKILHYKSTQTIGPLLAYIFLVTFIFVGIWWTTEKTLLLIIGAGIVFAIAGYGILTLHELTLWQDRLEITTLWNKRNISYFTADKNISIIIPGGSIYSPARTVVIKINDKTVSHYKFSSDWGTQDLYHRTKGLKYSWKIHSTTFLKDYERYLKYKQTMEDNKR